MMDVLGWLAVIGIVSYLGHYLYLMLKTDREIDDNIIEPLRRDMNSKQDLRDRYQQLRIKQRDLDRQITKLEKNKNGDTNKLGDLYRDRARLKAEISEVAAKL